MRIKNIAVVIEAGGPVDVQGMCTNHYATNSVCAVAFKQIQQVKWKKYFIENCYVLYLQ